MQHLRAVPAMHQDRRLRLAVLQASGRVVIAYLGCSESSEASGTLERSSFGVLMGCNFMVSPGATGSLLKAANDLSIPLLPGISTISEIMCAMEYGYRDFKFFPAECSKIYRKSALQ